MANAPVPAPPVPVPPQAPAPPAPPASQASVPPTPVPVGASPVQPVAALSSQEEAAAPLTPEEIAARRAAATLAALDTSDVSQANAATGVYGDSGTGKTSQMATAAEYCWETYKRITHFYAVDLGGYGNKMIKLMKLGIVRGYAPRNHVEPFETAELISMGYFPETVIDKITGYADPFVKLIPPQFRRFTVYCSNGHAVAQTTNRRRIDGFQQQCPTCKVLTNIGNWSKVEEQVITSPGFKHVGLRLYDSGTGMQDWVMEDLAGKAAKSEFTQTNNLGAKEGGSKVVSGDMVFGSNQISHYGFAQNRMSSWIANSRRIPGNVVPPIWSFLEQKGKDDGNIIIFGPSIAGNAKTSDVPSWLGNCLHLAKVPNDRGEMVNRIYLQNHSSVNEGNIPHLAKHRGDAGTMPPYLEDEKDQPPFTKCSLKYFFIQMELALQKSLQAGVEQYADAPALVGLADDDKEEILSTTAASVGAQTYHSPAVTGPVAGAVANGVPMPPGGPMGVPMPPAPPAGVAAPPAAPAPLPIAAPAPVVPAGVPGPRPPVPVAVAAPQITVPVPVQPPPAAAVPMQPAAPVVGSPAPGAPLAASLPVVAAGPAAPATTPTPSTAGGAPVRPPTTVAVAASVTPPAARAGRPPVPAPPGPPKSA